MDEIKVTVRGQKIGPSMTVRSHCALKRILAELQRAIVAVEDEIEKRMEVRK